MFCCHDMANGIRTAITPFRRIRHLSYAGTVQDYQHESLKSIHEARSIGRLI
jgi:hypothetical protein